MLHARCDDLQPAHPLTTISADRLRMFAVTVDGRSVAPVGHQAGRFTLSDSQKWKRAGSGKPRSRVALTSNRLTRDQVPSALAV